MALEIEVKARVDEPELLKTRLSAFGKADCSYEKEDTYWFPLAEKAVSGNGPALPPSGLRVRRENNGPFGTAPAEQRQTTLVTYKIREPPGADGIEVNQEREFTVSDAGVFEELLGRLGLAPGIGKHKQGWAWNCAGKDGDVIRAELSEVRGLGWFIELEIVAPESAALPPEKAAETRKSLLDLLEKLEITREKIEKRPYTVMLRAL